MKKHQKISNIDNLEESDNLFASDEVTSEARSEEKLENSISDNLFVSDEVTSEARSEEKLESSISDNNNTKDEKIDISKMSDSLPKNTSFEQYKEKEKFKKEIEHEKKGLDFSIFLVIIVLLFLIFVSFIKLMSDVRDRKTVELNDYFSLFSPMITTALGYILGKKNN